MSASGGRSGVRPVALVTGAARRIGRSIALGLAGRGYDVAIHYQHSEPEALGVVREAEALGIRAVAIAAELARMGDVAGLMAAAHERLGPVSVLVNNASEFRDDTAMTLDAETWAAHIDVNLRAPLFLAQAFVRQLPDGVTGHIINIIDQRVLRPSPEFFSYSVSKAALWAATRTLAQALAPRVRVNAIGPGPVLASVHQSAADFAAECEATLLKRGASPDEVAAAVLFLLDAPAITGQLIALDGGQHLA